jgi:phage-related protein (TIGR01555 family)
MGLLDLARALLAPRTNAIAAAPQSAARADSWSNLVTGIGAATGRLDFQFTPELRIADQTLEDMFHDDPYASRIVRAVPEEAMRRGFSVSCGDPKVESQVQAALDELHVLSKVTEAWTWARLFGGAALFVGADDGRDPALPLDAANIRAIRFVTVLDKRELYPAKWFKDPLSPHFGEPETYRFSRSGAGGTDTREVHATRLVRFDGAVTTRRRRQQHNGWSESELQRVLTKLREFNGNSAAASTLLQDASQGVFKIKDLMSLIAQDKQDVVRKRLQLMDMARGVARAIMLDADGESFERVESGVATGMADLVDKSFLLLAGAAEIPVTILFGQAPAGLSATGDSDIRWFYDRIDSARTNNVKPRIERIVRMLLRAKNGPTGGVEPPSWAVEFPSLYQLTDGEDADLRSKQATIDAAYIHAQVLTPEEVRASRFRREGYSTETSIDDDSTTGPDTGELGDVAVGVVPEDALAVVKSVAAREIPRDSGLQAILAAMPGLAIEQAEKIMGEAGKTFFTVPDPLAQPELEQLRAENAALKRSVHGLKTWNSRIVQRAKDGGLELGGLVDRPPTEVAEGDDLQEGDVVAVPAEPEPAPADAPSASAEAEKADGRADAQTEAPAAPARCAAVVLPLPANGREALAPVSQLPLDQLHVTLAYFEQLTDEQLTTLRSVVAAWARHTKPFGAQLDGHGRFAGENGVDPVYAAVTAPDLDSARYWLVAMLKERGLEPSAKHSFVPHVTLAYVAPGVELEQVGSPTPVTFGAVAVWRGEEHDEPTALGPVAP